MITTNLQTGRWDNPNSGWGGTATQAPATTPIPASVNDPFQQALAALSGANSDVEKSYQTGKRKTLADIAMQSINAGMGNTLNMPAAGVAYDEANRAQTNLAAANAKVGVLTGLGQTAAGLYGVNTQAGTAAAGQALDYSATTAGQALNKYLGELDAKYKYSALAAQAATQGSTNPYTGPAITRSV